jgi:hypothetical protein
MKENLLFLYDLTAEVEKANGAFGLELKKIRQQYLQHVTQERSLAFSPK